MISRAGLNTFAIFFVLLGGLPSFAKEAPVIDFDLYGFVKLDLSYQTARTNLGNFNRWVTPHALETDDPQMNITANQSRFGFKIKGPRNQKFSADGQLEMDFYSGEGGENKAQPYMRHAFMKVSFIDSGFDLIAGQTWDLIAPLNPSTVNYSVQWWLGNIGYRRPQIRLTKEITIGKSSLSLAGAVLRTIGRPVEDADKARLDPGDSGEDAALPTVQGRLGFSFPLSGKRKSGVGFSGHWAREEFDKDAKNENETLDSWSGVIDLELNLGSVVNLKAEAWMGKNMNAYLGGIGQGVNAEREAIAAQGGWAAVGLGSFGKFKFNFGASVDDPEDDDLSDGARTFNMGIFANTFITLVPQVTLALEASRLQTDYKQGDEIESAAALSFQSAFILKL